LDIAVNMMGGLANESNMYYTYSRAISMLQTPSSSYGDRMSSIRFLQHYVHEEKTLTNFDRRRINQLVMDNVMQMVMNEERTADLRKRQIIKTECFVILANLLDSETLFGNIKTSYEIASEVNSSDHKNSSIQSSSAVFSSHKNGTRQLISLPGDDEQALEAKKREESRPPESLLAHQQQQQGQDQLNMDQNQRRYSLSTGEPYNITTGFNAGYSDSNSNFKITGQATDSRTIGGKKSTSDDSDLSNRFSSPERSGLELGLLLGLVPGLGLVLISLTLTLTFTITLTLILALTSNINL
jgi:hypothetical protein